jgi:hypothetical protein
MARASCRGGLSVAFICSACFCGGLVAAGPDGNPPVRYPIKLARLGGAVNQTGFPNHWLDRYSSSTATANNGLRVCQAARWHGRQASFRVKGTSLPSQACLRCRAEAMNHATASNATGFSTRATGSPARSAPRCAPISRMRYPAAKNRCRVCPCRQGTLCSRRRSCTRRAPDGFASYSRD